MKLYLLTQDKARGYDTYDSVVVAAENKTKARSISPSGYKDFDCGGAWCTDPKDVDVTYLGEAKTRTKEGVILASFNAG